MHQKSVCLFLTPKILSAPAADNEFTALLGVDVITYSVVTKYLRQRQFTSILV
jgi:hypothetical protein